MKNDINQSDEKPHVILKTKTRVNLVNFSQKVEVSLSILIEKRFIHMLLLS